MLALVIVFYHSSGNVGSIHINKYRNNNIHQERKEVGYEESYASTST